LKELTLPIIGDDLRLFRITGGGLALIKLITPISFESSS